MSRLLYRLEFLAGALILAVITVLVFMAAVMRFFGHPLIWSVDMAQLLFIWLCFLGASRAMRQRAHLGVDLIVSRFPIRWRLYVETALAMIILAFLVALMWLGYGLTMLNIEREFGDSGLSYAFVTSAVPLGSCLLAISILINLFHAWQNRDTDALLVFTRVGPSPMADADSGSGVTHTAQSSADTASQSAGRPS